MTMRVKRQAASSMTVRSPVFRARGISRRIWQQSLSSAPAYAHVKWFAPNIVGAPPQPMMSTLNNVWFWTGLALVLVFFTATRLVERSSAGPQSDRGASDVRTAPIAGSAD